MGAPERRAGSSLKATTIMAATWEGESEEEMSESMADDLCIESEPERDPGADATPSEGRTKWFKNLVRFH